MGVPGFFAWLLKRDLSNKILLDALPTTTHHPSTTPSTSIIHTLYLDANCLIHPQCYATLEKNPNWDDIYTLESKMITSILEYITNLVDIVNPTHLLYIAVDGVAPMAKISQQRKRRYKSYDEQVVKNKIKAKYNLTSTLSSIKIWNNTAITPGTEFMERLHESLNMFKKHIKSSRNINVIYSSYHSPGEGEHKILQDIKANTNTNTNNNLVVYGLDADLIFLALASNKKNIYLMRESNVFDKNTQNTTTTTSTTSTSFKYVNIDSTKEFIDINIKDFIFICYLLGNDFIPSLPSIHIRTNGLDLLIKCYLEVISTTTTTTTTSKTSLIDNTTNDINYNFLHKLFIEISKYEDYYFKKILPNYLSRPGKTNFKDNYEKEIWELENLKDTPIVDYINLGQGSPTQYKSRYYEYYFDLNPNSSIISDVCSDYLVGLNWITKYYFDKVPSWNYYYKYTHPPFITDLVKYFTRIDQSRYLNNSTPISPCTQLLLVTPPGCANLLPSSYKNLITENSTIKYMYPSSINLDKINKFMLHECIPDLPNIDLSKVVSTIRDIKLSTKESIRNLDY